MGIFIKSKKKLLTLAVAFLFACILAGAISPGTAVYADSATTIKVDKVSSDAAKRIDKALSKGKSVTLKVKGGDSNVKKLKKKVAKANKNGIIFQCEKGSSDGAYTSYSISTDNAKLYKYSNKFIKKMLAGIEKEYKADSDYEAKMKEVKLYPDADELRLRKIYDYFINSFINYGYYTNFFPELNPYSEVYATDANGRNYYHYTYTTLEFSGYDQPATVYCDLCYSCPSDVDIDFNKINESLLKALYKGAAVSSSTDEVMESDYIVWSTSFGERRVNYVTTTNETKNVNLVSFEEFKKLVKKNSDLKKSIKYMVFNNSFDSIVLKALDDGFASLSDACKVYVIDKSGYFNCRFERKGFGMCYDLNNKNFQFKPVKDMKTMLDNKAIGVCMTYTFYECLLFDQLGITNFENSNYAINHMWSIVKVKNSSGKTLWIPFDYGIGPSEGLAVDEATRKKYLKTEAMRYKLYLKGIEGAPSKKNFTDADFN